jgi:hypothetical protein
MGAAYLSWREKYGSDWESKFRETFETAMIERYDTHFYVGTIADHPENWLVSGLYYPGRQEGQQGLLI